MRTTIALQFSKLAGILFLAFAAPVCALAPEEEKIYVAIEGESRLAVFDSATNHLLRHIDLSSEQHGMRMPVAPHNVQVAPDGQSVWVTANAGHGGHGGGHEAMGHEGMETPTDEVIVVDPRDDIVIRRIPIAKGAHLAHVVVTPDSSAAYVTAHNENAIYKINARSYEIERKIQTPAAGGPHGLRIAPDGSRAYIALLQGKSMGILDLKTGQFEAVPLDGAAVQTAVTPDSKLAMASLYDSRKLAVYDAETKTVHYIELFKRARGPVQLYPTPDGRYVYVADQGHYFDQPDSEWVYKIDLSTHRVIWSIKAGTAPHGIAISKDGLHAYVTNLVSDDLSVIDLKTDQEAARLPVGREPNGVSIWNRQSGGTP